MDQQLLDRVLASPRLPSLPTIAIEIIGLVQQDEANVDKIAQTISMDPALSSKLLKTVNSSFYGQPKTVGSVQQAVIVLGLNSVKTLALGFSLVANLADAGSKPFDHMLFWRRCLLSATAAKQVCYLANIVQAEEVFLASLLQDVGMLALSQVLGDEYDVLLREAGLDHRKLSKHERAMLHGDHADVGAALAESWGLPPLLIESIRLHEDPDRAPENLRQLVRVVSVGSMIAGFMMHPEDEDRAEELRGVLQRWFNLDDSAAEPLLKDLFKDAREMQRLFDLPTGEWGKADDILGRANLALENLSLRSVKENEELKQINQKLRDEAHTDPLTKVGNRRSFDEKLDEMFMEAGEKRPLSVLFLDIDHFKRFNDEYGHSVGDKALVYCAEILRRLTDKSGNVYRLGGEEFAVLCMGVPRAEAAALAENVRHTMHDEPLPNGEGESNLEVTVSVGVATYDGTGFKRADQLLRAADQAVYAAKRGGRNAVRVFVPRKPGGPGTDKSEAA